MYQAGSNLFKAVTAFVINSPYSYEDTLRLMTNWYNSIEHKNAPGEMDKLVQRDYYREGIHRQHNNSYFHNSTIMVYRKSLSLKASKKIVAKSLIFHLNYSNSIRMTLKRSVKK